MHLFGQCIIWHTSMTKKLVGSQCLIHISSMRPADWEFASAFQSSYTVCLEAEVAERERRRRTCRQRWHVAGETAGCLPTGTDAAGGAVLGEHTSLCEADIIFFFSPCG